MPLSLANVKFNSPDFRPTQNLNYLLGCIGEKIIVRTEYYYENIIFALEDNQIICAPTSQQAGTFTNEQELVYCPDLANAFAEYEVGDLINIQGSAAGNNNGGGGFLITEKISNQMIRCAGATFSNEVLPYGAGAYLSNITEYKGLRYAYNFLDSGSNYNSLVDGELQQLTTPNADNAVNQFLSFTGITSYQIGGAVAWRQSFTAERQTFIIEHTVYITPFFLANQWSSLVARIKPSYFTAGNCLKYLNRIQLTRTLASPLSPQTLSQGVAANTGWFNETFNGGATNYSISNYSLIRTTGLVPLTALEFTNEVQFSFKVNNPGAPFSNGNTKAVLNFCYLPEDESQYQNNGRNLTQNFIFDRAALTLNATPVNGSNFGGSMQVIKQVTATFVNASQMLISGTIEIGSMAQSIMTEGDFSRYMLWVTTENHALADEDSDRVPLLFDVNEIYVQTVEADLIDATTVFIKHPYTDKADGEPATEVFPVDDVAAHTDFSIDFTGRESDNIKINKINARVFLTNGIDPDIILDDFVLNTNAYPLIAALQQNINFQQNRVFNIPAGEIRKVIDIQNDFAADAGLVRNWYLNYPFMVRWEYYLALLGIVSPPAGIFDNSEPLNGINNFWHRMTTIAGWQLKYHVKFFFEQKGDSATQTFESAILSHDYQSNPDWINETIKSYDINTLAELTFSGDKYIQGYQNTKIVASFEWAGAGAGPVLADVVMVIWIERFEASGVSEIRRISSLYVLDSGSWFLSTDGSGLVVLDENAGVYTGECLVNSALLPPANKYTIYARLYHLPTSSVGNKEFNDDDLFDFQDAAPYDFN